MRNFPACEAHLRSGNFAPPPHIESSSRDLSGKTIGILGMGGIGLQFVAYIRPFGMKMIYHNRRISPLAPQDVEYCDDMYEMLGRVDVLTVNVPLNAGTRGLLGRKEIRSMKRGSIIINTARGAIIDEEEMILALQDGHVSDVARCMGFTNAHIAL
jgi:glyoxylate reductase